MPDPAFPPTPPVRLASLLAREDLALRQIAGPAAAGVAVRWAHTSEMADPFPYLLGGELLLTAGVHIPERAGADTGPGDYFDGYVSRIVAAGGAALGFGLAPVHDRVPRALADACEAHGLPLLEVPPQTTFSGVARAVWQLMAQARTAELRRVTEAQQSLAAAAARTDPVPSVLRRLARRVGGRAVLYGPEGAEIATAGRTPRGEAAAPGAHAGPAGAPGSGPPGTAGPPGTPRTTGTTGTTKNAETGPNGPAGAATPTRAARDAEAGPAGPAKAPPEADAGPTGTAQGTETRPAGTAEAMEARPAGAAYGPGAGAAKASPEADAGPTGTAEGTETRPAGTAEAMEARPAGAAYGPGAGAAKASPEADAGPTGTAQGTETRPAGAATSPRAARDAEAGAVRGVDAALAELAGAVVARASASASDSVAGVHLTAYALGAGQGFVLGVAAPRRDSGDHTIASVAAVLLSLLTGEHRSGAGAARSSALVRLLLGSAPADVAALLGAGPWHVVHARPDGPAAPDPVAASALGAALGSPLVDLADDAVRVLLPGGREPGPQQGWTLGVSAAVEPARWPAADVQAGRALARARATRTALVRHGGRPALADLVPRAEAETHAAVLLAPLGDGAALRETLRTWLSLHGSWDRTAVALSVHRNTVRQRVARCAALLEADLDDPDVRMELWFALREG
ncbi:PucR family transcriptional regulator ligand-binding domain-containing protein [Streptomyces sp. NPDC093094]|uniref:PucR family transcriptional regulator ligand-binding domain-containing protein n=1 Tax=Streptomyces sp. NPDC093094 TaxID=3366026 RepID=UPI003808BA26